MSIFSTIVDFCLLLDRSVDTQIWAVLTRSQCRVSDKQVTVKVCDLFHLEIKISQYGIFKRRILKLLPLCTIGNRADIQPQFEGIDNPITATRNPTAPFSDQHTADR